jgi:hypothetical protein
MAEADASRNLNARLLSNLSCASFSNKSNNLTPLVVMSDANTRATLTSWIFICGGVASSSLPRFETDFVALFLLSLLFSFFIIYFSYA